MIYAFCKNVDNQEQKNTSQNILKSAILEQKLLLSEVSLYEFAFVSQKLQESKDITKSNLDFLSKYIKTVDVCSDVIAMMNLTSSYKNSFDVYHIVFSNAYNCSKLITFDKGFDQFRGYTKVEIEVL